VIYVDYTNDSAIVLFLNSELKLPEIPVGLLPADTPCGIGIDVGWLGYPVIEAGTLCFFAGTVSARQESRRAYLIDGVAINGVSGGPVFHCVAPDSVQVIGSISAYHANRATGEALPGLLRAQDVSHFHQVLQHVRNIDEAVVKKKELEAAQGAAAKPSPEVDVAASAEPEPPVAREPGIEVT
jgi:hypothetical protein